MSYVKLFWGTKPVPVSMGLYILMLICKFFSVHLPCVTFNFIGLLKERIKREWEEEQRKEKEKEEQKQRAIKEKEVISQLMELVKFTEKPVSQKLVVLCYCYTVLLVVYVLQVNLI